jgi:hypothetical protein
MRLNLPDWLFNLLKRARKVFWSLNTRGFDYPPMPPEIRQALLIELGEAIDFVETYLDRPLPAWRHIQTDKLGDNVDSQESGIFEKL